MSRICLEHINVGLKVGTAQATPDKRICLSSMNVQLQPGGQGIIIIYGAAGAITYGGSGKIVY